MRLKKFNVLMLFDYSHVEADAQGVDLMNATPQALNKITDSILEYVRQGGGLYVYGFNFNSAGVKWPTDTMNDYLLKRLGAEVVYEELHDPDFEKKQQGGAELNYFYTDHIATHPATTGVKGLWYPTTGYHVGKFTRPLRLGSEWTPLYHDIGQVHLQVHVGPLR